MKFQIIFVVGVGRSGTSLLQSMLNAHSDVASLPETQFFRKYVVNKNRKKVENQGPNSFRQSLMKDKNLNRLKKVSIEELESLERTPLNLLNVYHEILSIYSNSKSYIVDKDPRSIDFYDKLFKELKNVKVLQIVRDPRDIVLSKTKADWSSNRPYWLHALIGEAQLFNSSRKLTSNINQNFYQVQYEKLIENPEKTLNEITKFLEINFEKSMLSFGESAKELISEEEIQWKKETLGPLLKSNKNKWEKELSKKQIRIIEIISSSSMKRFGYRPSVNKYSLRMKINFGVIKVCSYFFNRLYILFK